MRTVLASGAPQGHRTATWHIIAQCRVAGCDVVSCGRIKVSLKIASYLTLSYFATIMVFVAVSALLAFATIADTKSVQFRDTPKGNYTSIVFAL